MMLEFWVALIAIANVIGVILNITNLTVSFLLSLKTKKENKEITKRLESSVQNITDNVESDIRVCMNKYECLEKVVTDLVKQKGIKND